VIPLSLTTENAHFMNVAILTTTEVSNLNRGAPTALQKHALTNRYGKISTQIIQSICQTTPTSLPLNYASSDKKRVKLGRCRRSRKLTIGILAVRVTYRHFSCALTDAPCWLQNPWAFAWRCGNVAVLSRSIPLRTPRLFQCD